MAKLFSILTGVVVITLFTGSEVSFSEYKGSQAYNHFKQPHTSVNIATGTLNFSYPLIKASGIHYPFSLNLTYQFNSTGKFGLPKGWELDIDHINDKTLTIGGQQWLIDPLWHDETFFASGLKYFNQHGSKFYDIYEEQPIPAEPSLYYRYKAALKDGSVKYFANDGLLVLEQDRFGNCIKIEYEQPIYSIKEAMISAITDQYNNRYTFSYEPSTIIIHYPDSTTQHINFSPEGVLTIRNPLHQYFKFEYIDFDKYKLIRTLKTPNGLLTELAYSRIPIKNSVGTNTLPVVTLFKQSDLATNKIHHETHYSYSSQNNYTGYPQYSMSYSGDSLIDSNDQNYRYTVDVKHVSYGSDGSIIHEKRHEYNYLHLPVTIYTYKQGKMFLQTRYDYLISPFKYERSTNYDKPVRVIHSIWSLHHRKFILSNRTDHDYDLYGNKTREKHWIYDRELMHWRQLRDIRHTYFNDNFSLLSETIDKDMISGKAIKTVYHLSPSKKNYNRKRTYFIKDEKNTIWQPWQQVDYRHDQKGREISSELKWLTKDMPGVQKTHNKTRYYFNDQSKVLTTEYENSHGHVTKELKDTRNDRLIAQISALGEKVQYGYNELGQIIQYTDPEGNIYSTTYQTYERDGLNSSIAQSPLGLRQRQQQDASGRVTVYEEEVDGHYQIIKKREYNAFGKLTFQQDQLGRHTSYEYDDQIRLTGSVDTWRNTTTIVYDDDHLLQNTYVNGFKHKTIKQIPWRLTTQITHYPARHFAHNPDDKSAVAKGKVNDTQVVEQVVKKNGFDQILWQESALLDLKYANRHSIIKSTFDYDAGHNTSIIHTQGFDDISLTKRLSYDLFNNIFTYTKSHKNNNVLTHHDGYRHIYNSENQLECVLAPNSKTPVNSFRYDGNGREIERKLADGNAIKYQYNARGLLSYTGWEREGRPYKVFHQYDADGHLTKMYDNEGQTQKYQYDLRGNLTQLVYPDQQCQIYTYDKNGRLTHWEAPDITSIAYHYNDKDNGKISAIKSTTSQLRFIYGENSNGLKGQLLAVKREMAGSGNSKETFTYEPFGNLAHTNVTVDDDVPLFAVDYQFLPRGQLIRQEVQMKNASQQKKITLYDYDSLNRLKKESHYEQQKCVQAKSPQLEIRYQYDGNNNLIKEQRISAQDSTQTTYRTYNDQDQLVSIKHDESDKGYPILYDVNGRISVDYNGNRYQYDDAGLLSAVFDYNDKQLVRFDYLPDGLLGHIQSNQSKQSLYFDKNNFTLTLFKNDQWHVFLTHQRKNLAVLRKNGADHLFITNQSTGARLTPDEYSDQETTLYSFEGYGRQNTKNQHQKSSGIDFLWNQELLEKKSGLVYLRNRFYSPQHKRFITRDNVHVDNRYSYALANPIAFVDPSGHGQSNINYLYGGMSVLLGLIGVLFAIPTGGASMSISAAAGMAGGVSTGLSGLSLMASQAAMGTSNKTLSRVLQIASLGIGMLGAMDAVIAVAPTLARWAGTDIEMLNDYVWSIKPPKSFAAAFQSLPTVAKSAVSKIEVAEDVLQTLASEQSDAGWTEVLQTTEDIGKVGTKVYGLDKFWSRARLIYHRLTPQPNLNGLLTKHFIPQIKALRPPAPANEMPTYPRNLFFEIAPPKVVAKQQATKFTKTYHTEFVKHQGAALSKEWLEPKREYKEQSLDYSYHFHN